MELITTTERHLSSSSLELLETHLKNFVSPNTQRVYFSTLKKFFGVVKPKSFSDISHLKAIDYRDHLISVGLSNLSINREMATLSSFFRHLKNKGVIFENPFLEIKRLPATTKKTAVFPQEADIERIVESFKPDSRHRLFFETLSATAQRISTVLGFQKKSFFYYEEKLCINVKLKGGKTKAIPFPYVLQQKVEDILATLKEEDFLFSTDGVKAWNKRNINTILERRLKKLGIRRNITPHAFRRYKLNSLLKKHDPVRIAETVSFHSDLNTLIRHYKKEAEFSLDENPLLSYTNAGDEDFRTPQALFDSLNRVFGGFTLDASASKENSKTEKYYSVENCGLKGIWDSKTFCNPPFSRNADFVLKATEEASQCKVIAMVIPARITDTVYYHQAVESGFLTHKLELKGRINYDRPLGKQYSASFASLVLVFNGDGFNLEPLKALGLLIAL